MTAAKNRCALTSLLSSVCVFSICWPPIAHANTVSGGGDGSSVTDIQLTDAGRRPAQAKGVLSSESWGMLAEKRDTEFTLVGLSWRKGVTVDDSIHVNARFETKVGWGDWQEIPLEEHETGSGEGSRSGSVPYFTGKAKGIQLRVEGPTGKMPADLRLSLIGPGSDGSVKSQREVTETGQDEAEAPFPVKSRADWEAAEIKPDGNPVELRPTGRALSMFVHHTVSGNAYSRAEVPGIIKGIQTYDHQTLGYEDITYNFIVDRFGQVWESRKGSIKARPGADPEGINSAAQGVYNPDTLAVAVLGNHHSSEPGYEPVGSEALRGLADVLAWKGIQYGLDPLGKVTLPTADKPTVNVISGHRDVLSTACPGDDLHRKLPELRDLVAARMAASRARSNQSFADFRGSGVQDLVARAGTSGDLKLWPGRGDGTFGAPAKLTGGWSPYEQTLAGDFTSDGKADLIAVETSTGDLKLWPGRGDGTFGAPAKLTGGWSPYEQTLTGDFTSDGKADLIAVETSTGDLKLWPGRGDGTFGAPKRLTGGWSPYEQTLTGDFTSDGKADLIAVETSTGDLKLWPGRGDGTFGAPKRLTGGWSPYEQTLTGDLNNDGKDDLVAMRRADGMTVRWYGLGGGTFGSPTPLDIP